MVDDLNSSVSGSQGSSLLAQVPIEITVSVGRARPLIGELLVMGSDTVLPLDRRINDPVELYIGDKLVAHGELEELGGENKGQLAVRLTNVTDPMRDFS
jgi:flagellar motor switch protein FliN/FliY